MSCQHLRGLHHPCEWQPMLWCYGSSTRSASWLYLPLFLQHMFLSVTWDHPTLETGHSPVSSQISDLLLLTLSSVSQRPPVSDSPTSSSLSAPSCPIPLCIETQPFLSCWTLEQLYHEDAQFISRCHHFTVSSEESPHHLHTFPLFSSGKGRWPVWYPSTFYSPSIHFIHGVFYLYLL